METASCSTSSSNKPGPKFEFQLFFHTLIGISQVSYVGRDRGRQDLAGGRKRRQFCNTALQWIYLRISVQIVHVVNELGFPQSIKKERQQFILESVYLGSTPKQAIIQKNAQCLLFAAHPAALFMDLCSTGLSQNKPKTKDSSCSKAFYGFSVLGTSDSPSRCCVWV